MPWLGRELFLIFLSIWKWNEEEKKYYLSVNRLGLVGLASCAPFDMIWMMKSAWPMHWDAESVFSVSLDLVFFIPSSQYFSLYLSPSSYMSFNLSFCLCFSVLHPPYLHTHIPFRNVNGGVGETRVHFVSFRFISFVCLHARTLISVLNISCPTVGTKGRCKKIFNWFVMCFLFLWLHYVVVSFFLLCVRFYTLYTTACVWNLFAFSMLADVFVSLSFCVYAFFVILLLMLLLLLCS